jgi:hypothetical protein
MDGRSVLLPARTGWFACAARPPYNVKTDLRGRAPVNGVPTFEMLLQRVHSDDRDWVRESTAQIFRHKQERLLEYRIVLPDGTLKYIESVRRPVMDEQGNVNELLGTSVDVTERKRWPRRTGASTAGVGPLGRPHQHRALERPTWRYINSSSESWEPQTTPISLALSCRWTVHSINNGHQRSGGPRSA